MRIIPYFYLGRTFLVVLSPSYTKLRYYKNKLRQNHHASAVTRSCLPAAFPRAGNRLGTRHYACARTPCCYSVVLISAPAHEELPACGGGSWYARGLYPRATRARQSHPATLNSSLGSVAPDARLRALGRLRREWLVQ